MAIRQQNQIAAHVGLQIKLFVGLKASHNLNQRSAFKLQLIRPFDTHIINSTTSNPE